MHLKRIWAMNDSGADVSRQRGISEYLKFDQGYFRNFVKNQRYLRNYPLKLLASSTTRHCQEQDHRLLGWIGRYINPSLKLLAKENLSAAPT
jgi:hypothetical protein